MIYIIIALKEIWE